MLNRSTSAKVARSASLEQLLDYLGAWTTGPGPIFQRLARAIAASIERGELPHDTRLPSERSLAAAAWVSRGTVVAAYDVLLGEGLADRRTGSGTFVASSDGPGLPQGREGSRLVAHLAARSDNLAGKRPTGTYTDADLIDLSISVLDDATALPHASVSTAELIGAVPDTGYDPRGQLDLRTTIAERLTGYGLASTPDQLVITTGAQQAISAAIACWVRPGDVVVVEDPTYPGALAALTAAGAVIRGLPLDRHGVRIEALEEAVADRPALAYLQSTVQSPTGVVLSSDRRRRIAALLTASRLPLVEDIALAGLTWAGPTVPIASHAPDHPIAVVGSISKMFWSGLRVGFVRAPLPVAQRLARIKTIQDLGSSTVSQLMASRLLQHPDSPAFTAQRNDELQRRCVIIAALIAAQLPAWSCPLPAGGLSLWVGLPGPYATRFAAVALAHGVAVAPPESLSVTGEHADHFRLSVAHPELILRVGVERLVGAWAAFTP